MGRCDRVVDGVSHRRVYGMVGADESIAVWERLIHPAWRHPQEENWLAFATCVMSHHYSVTRSLRKWKLLSASEYREEKTKEDDANRAAWSEWARKRRKRKKGKK